MDPNPQRPDMLSPVLARQHPQSVELCIQRLAADSSQGILAPYPLDGRHGQRGDDIGAPIPVAPPPTRWRSRSSLSLGSSPLSNRMHRPISRSLRKPRKRLAPRASAVLGCHEAGDLFEAPGVLLRVPLGNRPKNGMVPEDQPGQLVGGEAGGHAEDIRGVRSGLPEFSGPLAALLREQPFDLPNDPGALVAFQPFEPDPPYCGQVRREGLGQLLVWLLLPLTGRRWAGSAPFPEWPAPRVPGGQTPPRPTGLSRRPCGDRRRRGQRSRFQLPSFPARS